MTHTMMTRHRWIFAPLIIIGLVAITLITMLLWNSVMPGVFQLPKINFVQTISLLILSKILFGSHFRHNHRGGPFGLRHKIASMTPEERENFFKNIHERRSGCWNKQGEAFHGDPENSPV